MHQKSKIPILIQKPKKNFHLISTILPNRHLFSFPIVSKKSAPEKKSFLFDFSFLMKSKKKKDSTLIFVEFLRENLHKHAFADKKIVFFSLRIINKITEKNEYLELRSKRMKRQKAHLRDFF